MTRGISTGTPAIRKSFIAHRGLAFDRFVTLERIGAMPYLDTVDIRSSAQYTHSTRGLIFSFYGAPALLSAALGAAFYFTRRCS